MAERHGERVFLTYDEAVALLPEGDTIHTLLNPNGGMLIGADWSRDEILRTLRAADGKIEVTGRQAQAMGHGLSVARGPGLRPLFIQASEWKPPSNSKETPER